MRVWVDADACPGAIKEILYRAARRAEVETVLVANRALRVPVSRFLRAVRVAGGFDVADRYIADRVEADDLVVTADIPLAADVVARGATALDPRGELYTEENVGERLAMRDLMDELRGLGEVAGGPAPLGKRDRQAFANRLDAWISRVTKDRGGQRSSE